MRLNRGSGQLLSFATLLLLTCSVGINVLQARRINDLVNPEPVMKRIGKVVAPIDGIGSTGPTSVKFAGRPTVLYFFSTSCKWCERNWPNVKALQAAAADRYRFVALAIENDLREYAASRQLFVEMIGGLRKDVAGALRLGPTPQTLVVSPDGLITHEWVGAYVGRNQRQIEELFDVALPGLLELPLGQMDLRR